MNKLKLHDMHGVDYGGFAYGFWTVVMFSVLITLFLVFSYVKPQNKFEWRSMGAFIGFIVALFTYPYGNPSMGSLIGYSRNIYIKLAGRSMHCSYL